MARSKEFDEQAVLDKAMTVFWAQGYETTSIQDLVDEMQIHRRSLYDTFGDKHTLFLQTLDRYAKIIHQNFENQLTKDMPIREQLSVLFEMAISQNEDQPRGCLLVNSATELALIDEEVAKKIQELFTSAETQIYDLLSIAQRNGEISTAIDIKTLASYLHNSLVGIRVLAKTTNDKSKLESIIQLTLSIV